MTNVTLRKMINVDAKLAKEIGRKKGMHTDSIFTHVNHGKKYPYSSKRQTSARHK